MPSEVSGFVTRVLGRELDYDRAVLTTWEVPGKTGYIEAALSAIRGPS